MADFDPRQETLDAVIRRIGDLSEQSLLQLSQYISYLKWQEELWHSLLDDKEMEDGGRLRLVWKYDFLEAFPGARQASTRRPDLMEIKVGPASCGMVQQDALWQHPPVTGSAVVEYQLHVPGDIDRLRMQFGVGIRDGALMEGENLCAFRIFANGMRLWSVTKQSTQWERYLIDLPNLAGQDLIIQLMTDGLGDARWNWAVWAEPQLLGYRND
jgi:hypothetical protein